MHNAASQPRPKAWLSVIVQSCIMVMYIIHVRSKRKLFSRINTIIKQEYIYTVEHITCVHLDFERAICCGFTVFTKGAVFIV